MDIPYSTKPLKCLFALLIVASAGLCLQAQDTLYNDGEILYVQQGALLHVEGDLVAVDSSQLFNDGVIELTGNLHNDPGGLFKTGTDSVSIERCLKFIGDSVQNITGDYSTAGYASLYNLIIDKAASGTAVVMQTDVTVDGAVLWGSNPTGYEGTTYVPTANSTAINNQGQGVVQTFEGTGDHELYLSNSDPAAVAGFRNYYSEGSSYPSNSPPEDGYIQTRGAQGVGAGGFSRQIQSMNSDYWFPIGSSSNGYNPVILNFSSLPSGTDTVRGLFVDGIPSGNSVEYKNEFSSLCSAGEPGVINFDCLPGSGGYWSFAGDTQSVYNLVSFPKTLDICGVYGIDNMRLLKDAAPLNSIPSADWTSQVSNIAGSLDSNLQLYTSGLCYSGVGIPGGNYEGFNAHFMYTSGTYALLVSLASLSAQNMDNTFIRVSWTTYSEVNNAGFKVMRSTDGVNWTKLGWVDGNDNSSITHNYVWNDYTVSYGINYYYMLIQVDNNGGANESNTVTAIMNGAVNSAVVFAPNPANTFTTLIINSPAAEPVHIQLYDATGRLVSVRDENALKGTNKFIFDTQALPAGVYSAAISSPSDVISEKLIVSRD